MNFTTGEILSFLAALVAGGFVIWGEVIKRRTPSVEKEQEQEDQWRDELWQRNRDLSTDLRARETELKETTKLLHEVEKQNDQLKQQNALLQHEKAAWEIEREEMKREIASLKSDVFDLTRKIVAFERAQEGQGQGK